MKNMFKHTKWRLLLLLTCTFILIFLTDRYILTAAFYENNGDPFSGIPGQSTSIYNALQKWVYLSSAIYLLVKLFAITIILHTALYLKEQNVSVSKVFSVVVTTEFIFLIPAGIKLIIFNNTLQHANLLDWHRYHIFSALSLIENAPADWYYALESLNLFEFAYWFLLAFGISKITSKGFDESLRTVVFSYVPALFIWVITITFITLIMFPATS
jgi:hypothetical protein